MRTLTEMKGL
ncbi:hypothetical protein BsWGS_23893 [Bradybaena similaris]